MSEIKRLYLGLEHLFRYEELLVQEDSSVDIGESIFVYCNCEHPFHGDILKIEGWEYDHPYYFFYVGSFK